VEGWTRAERNSGQTTASKSTNTSDTETIVPMPPTVINVVLT
jgi:hypothetical protein